MKGLVPRHSRLFPSPEFREEARLRIANIPKERFETYVDWFYYIHIDPVQRWVHAFGMFVGAGFFGAMVAAWGWWSIPFYLIGVFFFYGFGVISHQIYDRGEAKSEPKYFLLTLWLVISINLTTVLMTYDAGLRRFVAKYPFAAEAFDLIEMERSEVLSHVLGRRP